MMTPPCPAHGKCINCSFMVNVRTVQPQAVDLKAKDPDNNKEGECQCHPPQNTYIPTAQGQLMKMSDWPTVRGGQGCGDYSDKAKPVGGFVSA